MKILERLLSETELSMEQKTAVRGKVKIMKEKYVDILKALCFAFPLVSSFALYHSRINEAIFWAIMANVGYSIYIRIDNENRKS